MKDLSPSLPCYQDSKATLLSLSLPCYQDSKSTPLSLSLPCYQYSKLTPLSLLQSERLQIHNSLPLSTLLSRLQVDTSLSLLLPRLQVHTSLPCYQDSKATLLSLSPQLPRLQVHTSLPCNRQDTKSTTLSLSPLLSRLKGHTPLPLSPANQDSKLTPLSPLQWARLQIHNSLPLSTAIKTPSPYFPIDWAVKIKDLSPSLLCYQDTQVQNPSQPETRQKCESELLDPAKDSHFCKNLKKN